MTIEPFQVEQQQYNEATEKMKRSLTELQYNYLSVYLLVMGADWLQGPYLYKLYQSYGLSLSEIAFLFLTGFVTGAVAGTTLGSLADSWGRRRVCLVFCWTTLCSLLLRLVPAYALLLVSHMMSGTATALLYSVFEAWYVAEHSARGLPGEWRARTFATATFLNSLVAILAGIVANGVVDYSSSYEQHFFAAPFLVAILLLCIASGLILFSWSENYGEVKVRVMESLRDGCLVLYKDSNILVLGAAQTVFECAMYIFVLLYTPAIENADNTEALPLGYLFSTMMLAVMLGSLTFQAVKGFARHDKILAAALSLASLAFCAMAYYGRRSSVLYLTVAYHVFEFSTGLYYPSIASLKAEAIPEETRAGVMTLLRIPMNVSVGLVMLHVEELSSAMLFGICSCITLTGSILLVLKYNHVS